MIKKEWLYKLAHHPNINEIHLDEYQKAVWNFEHDVNVAKAQVIQALLAGKSKNASRLDRIIYAFFKPNILDDDGFSKKGRATRRRLETGHIIPGPISMHIYDQAKQELNQENTRWIKNKVQQLDPHNPASLAVVRSAYNVGKHTVEALFLSDDTYGYCTWHHTCFERKMFKPVDVAINNGLIDKNIKKQFPALNNNGALVATSSGCIPINVGGDGSSAPNTPEGIDNFTHVFVKFAGNN